MNFEKYLHVALKDRQSGSPSAITELTTIIEAQTRKLPGLPFITAFLAVSYVLLPGISSMLFRFLACTKFPETDPIESYLAQDMSINCSSNRYKQIRFYVFACIAIFPVGIPTIYAVLLWQRRETFESPLLMEREERMNNPTIGHLQFLYETYSR